MKIHTQLKIAADHPAFAGHFPGIPIVPGVVLLDEVLHAISHTAGLAVTTWQISSVKFLSPLKPDEHVVIEHEQLSNGTIKFVVFETKDVAQNRQIVMGSLVTNQNVLVNRTVANQNDSLI